MACKMFQSLILLCSIFTSVPVAYSSEQPILFSKSGEMFAYCNKACCRDAQTAANLSFCVHSVHSHGDTSLGPKSSVALCGTLCPQARQTVACAWWVPSHSAPCVLWSLLRATATSEWSGIVKSMGGIERGHLRCTRAYPLVLFRRSKYDSPNLAVLYVLVKFGLISGPWCCRKIGCFMSYYSTEKATGALQIKSVHSVSLALLPPPQCANHC